SLVRAFCPTRLGACRDRTGRRSRCWPSPGARPPRRPGRIPSLFSAKELQHVSDLVAEAREWAAAIAPAGQALGPSGVGGPGRAYGLELHALRYGCRLLPDQ